MAWTALARFRQQGASISRNARLFLWMVFLSNVGVSGVFMLLYNLYLVQLGYHEDFIGLLTLVQMGAIAAGAVPAGALSERFGSKRVMVAGTIVVGFSTTGMCIFTHTAVLALLNFITGIGFAMRIVPYTPFLVRNTTRAERTLVFSANSAAISVAGTFGNLIGGQLPALFNRFFALGGATSIPAYRLSLVAGAAIGILAAIPMALATEDAPQLANGTSVNLAAAPQQTPTVARRDIVAFLAITVLYAVGGATISPFANVYFSRVLNLQASQISLIFSLSSILAAAATVGAASLAGRMGKIRAIIFIRTASMPFLLLVALFSNVWIGISAVVIRNVTEMASWPIDGAFLAEVVPINRQARIVAFRSVAWNGCWALTGFLAGQVIVHLGYSPLFALSAVLLVAGAAAYHFSFAGREHAGPAG